MPLAPLGAGGALAGFGVGRSSRCLFIRRSEPVMSDPELLLETRRFRVVRQSYRTSDGAEHIRETVQHPGAVTILPMVDGNHVCLIHNYRAAVDETLIELPAGTLEVDEDPLVAAGRELEEETGFRAGKLQPLIGFYMSPGILNERMHLFLATELTAGPTRRDAGEEIENLVVPWNEALELIHQGRIQDAKTLVALLYYDRLRQEG